mgnify:CR=1 FL=1|jgi:cell division protein FtsQ
MHTKKKYIKNSQNNDNIKKRKRKLEFILTSFLFIIVLVLFVMSPIFNVSNVSVYGNNHYTAQEIVKASEVVTGVNGFTDIGGTYKHYISLRYGQAEKKIIGKCPYIEEVSVKYSVPSKVIIQVKERNPIVLIPYLGSYLLVDRNGYVVDIINSDNKFNLPNIKGIKFKEYEIGHCLKIENKESFEELIILIDTLTEEDKSDTFKIAEIIDTIDISDSNNIYFFIDSRLVVNIGGLDELNYKIKSLKQIYFKNISKEEKGFLDFTAGEHPVFIPN